MSSLRRISRSAAFWMLLALLVLELAARRLTTGEALLRMGIASYPTGYAHRAQLAVRSASPGLVVVGDSSAERGLNACDLARLSDTRGLNLSLPSGALREADSLLELARIPADGSVLYAVNPLNISAYSSWVSPTFDDIARRQDMPSAILGAASALYGRRDAVSAIVASWFRPGRYRSEFNAQIGSFSNCGRETPIPIQMRSEAERAAQLQNYASSWIELFTERPGDELRASMVGVFSRWHGAGRQVSIVLMPFRSDFLAYVDEHWPGQRARKRELWQSVAASSGARVLDCAEGMPDAHWFDDPVHLNELGRRELTSCLFNVLHGRTAPCCVDQALRQSER